LARLLDLCISGDALAPFINNPQYQDKGIEMFHYLNRAKYPISASTASNTLNAMFTTKILQKESLEAYSKRLRNMYCFCTENGTTYQEDFLVRCFIQGLDSNYDDTRDFLTNGALDWYSLDLTTVKQRAEEIKLTKIADGSWFTDTSLAKAAGKQGAKRLTDLPSPDPSVNTTISYLTKQQGPTNKEAESCIRKFSCFLCRINNHQFANCTVAKRYYTIELKSSQRVAPTPAVAPTPTPRPTFPPNGTYDTPRMGTANATNLLLLCCMEC
jgi:hypothetical protein